MGIGFARRLLLLCLVFVPAYAQKYYTYLEDLGPESAEIAWGKADGANTLGRTAPSSGEATIKIAGRTLTSRSNSIVVGSLTPDHDYSYEILLNNKTIGQGQLRTWAASATKLTFFVIGDYGTGNGNQAGVARAMWQEFQKRAASDSPVRFVLSTGDNIYGNVAGFLGGAFRTGKDDVDWAPKFFEPYQQLIARIPWFATLGNHDGNETEARGDLSAYLDNMPFPNDKPGRYYTFTYGGLAKFLALDSTRNTESGPPRPAYLEDSAEFHWMQAELAKPKPAWVIPFYHHPVFNAGPLHVGSLRDLRHWVTLFAASGVKVVFNGHEHNFQMTEANQASGGIRFVTSGAGGELRAGSVLRKMRRNNIAAWAPQNHFLVVEIDGKTMKITPLSYEDVHIVDPDDNPVGVPITITLP